MEINYGEPLNHLDQFLLLEEDLIKTVPYVAFKQDNEKTYSSMFCKILLATASEVDTVAKLLCKLLDPTKKCKNICDYRKIIKKNLPEFLKHEIFISRYEMKYKPWESWDKSNQNPLWWKAYNNVKHKRDTHFKDASLKNTVNAIGALYISILYYYMNKFKYKNLEMTIDKIPLLKKRFISLEDKYYKPIAVFG